MTDNNRPITPPEEVIDKWESEWHHCRGEDTYEVFMAKQAARWGADQELEACCEWVKTIAMTKPWDTVAQLALELRAARRPKPPSLKEQALAVLDDASDRLDAVHENVLRRALETLPND